MLAAVCHELHAKMRQIRTGFAVCSPNLLLVRFHEQSYVSLEKRCNHLQMVCLKGKLMTNSFNTTLPETNIAPENRPSQKETHLPTTVFQVRTVSFRDGIKSGTRRVGLLRPWTSRWYRPRKMSSQTCGFGWLNCQPKKRYVSVQWYIHVIIYIYICIYIYIVVSYSSTSLYNIIIYHYHYQNQIISYHYQNHTISNTL